MALKFFWRCEGTTLDGTHDYSAGDTTATATSAVSIGTAGARVGTNGVVCSSGNGGDYYQFDVSGTDLANPAVGSAAFSFRLSTFVSAQGLFMLEGSSTQNVISVYTIGTDDATGRELRLITRSAGEAAVNVSTTGADLALDTWYGCVIRWDFAGNTAAIEVYNADGSLRTSASFNPDSAPTEFNKLRIGECVGTGVTTTQHIDNVFVADAYAEPLEDNLTITSYTEYGGGGGSAPTITDAGDETYTNGETGIVITGTNFGASQGTGTVKISPTDNVADSNAVTQTVTSWGDTSITFTCVRGTLALNTNLYLFVTSDGDYSNASGHVVQISGTRKLKLLIEAAAVGATVDGIVWAKAAGQIAGAEIGEFTGATIAAGTGADSGYAVLKVPVADFGGGALNVNDTVLCYVKNATNFAAPWDATIIEE